MDLDFDSPSKVPTRQSRFAPKSSKLKPRPETKPKIETLPQSDSAILTKREELTVHLTQNGAVTGNDDVPLEGQTTGNDLGEDEEQVTDSDHDEVVCEIDVCINPSFDHSTQVRLKPSTAEMEVDLAIDLDSKFFDRDSVHAATIKKQGIIKKIKVLLKRFDKIFESMIDQRQKLDRNGVGIESKDFLQVLLKLKDEADAKMPLTMTQIKALLMDLVVGGTDTTSNAVEFAMAEILNKPDVLRKLQQEVDTVVGKDNIVEESHIQQLPYLYAVMKEAMRIHPALPLLAPHCPSETITVGGYTVPKGSRVFVNVWAIHRDPSIWKNPTEFCPERFLDNKWNYSGNDFNYFPFGSGRRMCAGIAMAERMFMYSLASLIHSFDWKLPEGETLDLKEKFCIALKKKMPLVAIPTPRLSNPTQYE